MQKSADKYFSIGLTFIAKIKIMNYKIILCKKVT